MFQLVTQFGGYNLFAEIALGLFFFAFMLILVSTLIRPKSQMKHYARMALTEDIHAPRDSSKASSETSAGSIPQANDEHGAASHE